MIKILAIDDKKDNLISLKAIINDALPESILFTALNGAKGIELAFAKDPDVILLDIVMPGMDGFEVCRRLKQEDRLREIPVVFLTAIRDDKGSRIKALEIGAEAFLSKPIDETELTAQIRAMVKIKSANRQQKDEQKHLAKLVAERTKKLEQSQIATLNALNELKAENLVRKQAEVALKKSEERFRQVAHSAGDWIWEVDAKGVYTYASPYIKSMLGYQAEEIVGKKHFYDFFMPDVKEELKTAAFEVFAKKESFNGFENPNLHKDDRTIILETNGFPILDDKGKLIGYRGADKNITKRKQFEAELIAAKDKAEKSEKKFKEYFSSSPNGIFVVDINDENKYVFNSNNAMSEKIAGLKNDEMAGRDLNILAEKYGIEIMNYVKDLYDKVVDSKKTITFEEEVNLPDRTLKLNTSIKPLIDENGRVYRLLGTNVDISLLKQTELDLITAKEKAEESDRLKTAFLANMSHEIRTPMNSILGFAELLKEPNLSGNQQLKYIDIIEKGGARMLNIINDIVNISKIESGQMEVCMQESNISEQIKYIYTFFKPEIEGKEMQFLYRNSLPSKEPIIITDREKVYSILTNLVKNAIKFTSKGSIEIGYNQKDNYLEIYVKDTGVGIPEDRHNAIFERFIQADIADKNAYQGAGLGLSISKAYVEMLGGKIWVESQSGKGSTFYFTLPSQTVSIDNGK